jgi:hypothetical protein
MLRPNRGFPLGLAQRRRPKKFFVGLLTVSRCPNKIRILAAAIFCLMPLAAPIVVDSND